MLHPTYPLLTERLSLRPFRDDDLDALFAIQSRPDVVRYLYWEPRSRDETREMLDRRKLQTAIDREGDGIHLAAELRVAPGLIGHFNLHFASLEHHQGEIGFVLNPDHHGHGYGTEGAHVMLGLGFDGLGLHRIVGRCDGRNAASAGLMERLGMRREAHLVENEFVKGEWTDELVYAMLDREWQALKG
jgi:RimJ/RimL family protein N-acetyltransferase